MYYKLAHLPLLKLVIPFITGMLFFNEFIFPWWILLAAVLIVFCLLLISHLTIFNLHSKKFNAILVCLCVFLVGGILINNKKFENDNFHFHLYKAAYAKGIIAQPLEEKDKTFKTVICIHQLCDSQNRLLPVTGNLLAYIQKDTQVSKFEIGDEVLLHLNYRKVDGPKNPGQFDYSNYLSHKSIYQQQHFSSNEIFIIKKHYSLFVKRISDHIGMYVQSILKKYIPCKEQFALADGILLGHRADIDIELYNAFAYTGILHILSVSGLHVGIIYGMLLFLLGFIKDKNRKIKIAKFTFIFLFIWLFAFVTGFSAACVRAAILFSLLNYGKLSREHVSNLNLLCGAALLQLLIDPNNLFDIGFQLSYLAMLGLFIFYKPVYGLYYNSNKLIDWVWKLWSASIAAQLFTVPLSIYYFGNFPTYFLFANIFAIPMSAVILWLSIALIPFSVIPLLAHFIGMLDGFVIFVFIRLTYFFSELPLGKLCNLYISPLQMVLLLIAVLFLSFFSMKRRPVMLLACLGLFISTIVISYSYNFKQLKKDEIILYSVPKNLVIAVNKSDKQFLMSRDTISESNMNFSIKNSFRAFRINSSRPRLLNDSSGFSDFLFASENIVYVDGKTFYLLNRKNCRKAYSPAIRIDYLLLTDNCYLDTESLRKNFVYKNLIVSTDNDYRHTKIYKKLLQNNKMKYEDLNEHAIIIPL